MAELDVGSGEGHGFKLFGTMILTEERQPKTAEEEERSSSSSSSSAKEVGGAPEAAVAAAETARGAAALPCPRCRSRETKFCYFNNYNVNQPRHFCRACHRYWTAGGTLRNVPVGAGRRRNRPAARASGGAACVIEYPSPCLDAEVAAERWVLPHTSGGLPGGLR